ncbi:MAG: Dihydrolipoyllysine-residue succinyltransferase component of 2-oxoglutarate dehydrogenase complex [Chlamydiae bacterium]|nr:Dihydrolipoyllysine-residue succinyltransferase component of 2-oxoglutarate dehydrogenase complex [Chlamydiota bacterium]
MKIEIKVPSAGESISEATVSSILVESGSFVKADDEILELETDKITQVVYSPADGVLELTVKPDDVVTIGQVIGSVDTEQKAPSPPKEEEKEVAAPPPPKELPEEPIQEIEAPPRAQLKEENVTRRPMSGLRKTVAERLVAAKNQTAMLTTFNEVDMTQIMEIRSREQESFMKRNGVKLGFMSFFVKAAVAALKEFPDVNSYIDGEEIVTFQTYDVCIAVSTEKGLMVPVIRGCGEKSFGEIEKDIAKFATKAREGTISIDDIRGGSFTITNGGVFGSMLSTPLLNLPQSAILGMHTIVKRPVVVNDQIVIRPIMYLALSYDHRIIDGREAIQFLIHMKNNLEEPTRMLIDL